MNLIVYKWVYRIMYNLDWIVLKHKGRLVVKGFLQTPGVDYVETCSPIVKAPTNQVLFTLAVTFGCNIQQIDINNAFLHGDLIKEVYMS